MSLYLDIETIPTQSVTIREKIAATVTPPGNISKAETIAAWEADKKPALVKEAIAKTALDGAYGQVCCIGWAFNVEPPKALVAQDIGERDLIEQFLGEAERYVQARHGHAPSIVGHNVVNFDIRFLWQRAIVLGIRMPGWFPRDPKPWGHETFDTMTAFAGIRGMVGLDKLCEALGIEGKGDIDGSMIGDLWAAGEIERITEYCKADVERARTVHRRMLIAFGEAA